MCKASEPAEAHEEETENAATYEKPPEVTELRTDAAQKKALCAKVKEKRGPTSAVVKAKVWWRAEEAQMTANQGTKPFIKTLPKKKMEAETWKKKEFIFERNENGKAKSGMILSNYKRQEDMLMKQLMNMRVEWDEEKKNVNEIKLLTGEMNVPKILDEWLKDFKNDVKKKSKLHEEMFAGNGSIEYTLKKELNEMEGKMKGTHTNVEKESHYQNWESFVQQISNKE